MLDKKIYELAKHAASKTAPTNYSVETVEEALRGELKKVVYDYNSFMKNRYDIYDLIIKNADEIVPNKVISALKPLAEIQVVRQGQKAVFKVRKGKNRARKFLTQVGLSGVYETFRLDNSTFELTTHAIGGAASIDFERYLDGAEDMAELMAIITEGLTDAVFVEVQKALRSAINATNRPVRNKVTSNKFEADEMAKLISTVRAYSNGAVIFAPPEFIAAMGADAIVPVTANGGFGGVYSPADIEAIHSTGYINVFRGTPIVQIPQSFIDETNTSTWIDPQLAYVLPTNGEKIVKVVLEGTTQIRDFQNPDGSMEIHTWRKLGCGIITHHNWAVYQNTGITQTIDTEVYGI